MRRLIFQEYVTLDGYAADSDGGLDFSGTIAEQADVDNLALLETVDTMLLGAETYRLFAAAWPTQGAADNPIAPKLNALRKVVVSRTLDNAPWGAHESALVVRDAVEDVRELKREQGKDIILWGSISLFHTLLIAGLVDEVQLRVCPVLIGAGKPVFPHSAETRVLELVEARPWANGGALLRYKSVS
ncbi:reductase [Kribbella turkmenica]|uniref:Reductase n=1 Tax=Kribbella turkmenica TaxID=2530375 RepID=A0A4R4XDF8_9ACTN|nr:dihydrofolate reductase family protein [Kribbella turkmenica]TDD28811.1 reductase [Kribbella turkmenica]